MVKLSSGIYQDGKKIKIFGKITKENFKVEKYEKLNWLIQLRLKYKDSEYDSYSCKAQIVSLSEFTQQPQTKATGSLSEVERESDCELIQG